MIRVLSDTFHYSQRDATRFGLQIGRENRREWLRTNDMDAAQDYLLREVTRHLDAGRPVMANPDGTVRVVLSDTRALVLWITDSAPTD